MDPTQKLTFLEILLENLDHKNDGLFMQKLTIFVLFFVLSTHLFAQKNPQPQNSSLDIRQFGVVYEIPEMKNVRLTPGIIYFKDAKSELKIDVYTPPGTKLREKRPAVIFFNAVGDDPESKPKDWAIYKTWAKLVAAHGFIGVTMEADGERIQANLSSLFDFIEKDGDKYGIDANSLGVYAASANVTQSSDFLLNPNAPKGIKAAVLYYGGAPETSLRKDLPVLFITAEGDRQRMGESTLALWRRIVETGAPWTMVFASNQPHAFDSLSDTPEARRLIQQTIAFWKSNLETPPAQTSQTATEERAIMAAIYGNNPQKAAELLKPYVGKNPNDVLALGQYGEVLQQLKRFDESLAAFQKALALKPNDAELYGAIGRLHYARQNYPEAAQYLSKGISFGLNGAFIFNLLANAQMANNQPLEAIKSYEKAIERGITKNGAYYNIACAYIRLNQNDRAFEYLNKAIDEGFINRATFEADTDLASIRPDPRFKQLLERLPKTAN